MSLEDLKRFLEIDDLEFVYNDKLYYICLINNTYFAGEANRDDTEYKTFDDLINNFIIEENPLKDIIKDIYW